MSLSATRRIASLRQRFEYPQPVGFRSSARRAVELCRVSDPEAVRPAAAAVGAGAVCVPESSSAFLQPGLIIRGCIDHERPFHAVMAEAAKLAANHFVGAGLDRL